MPAIVFSYVDFRGGYYYIDLQQLHQNFPHLSPEREVEVYVIEVRNEQDHLVKRFKPFKKLQLKTSTYYYQPTNQYLLSLTFSDEEAAHLNLGKNYRVLLMISKYDGKSFLPLELKTIGYGAEKATELFSNFEADLLLLQMSNPILNEAVSYLWDSHSRLQENDIEGARTLLRNSLEVLTKSLLPKASLGSAEHEAEDFLKRLQKLIDSLRDFLHYGGPHRGPAPRTSTEMILSLAIHLIKHLSLMIEKKIILLQGD